MLRGVILGGDLVVDSVDHLQALSWFLHIHLVSRSTVILLVYEKFLGDYLVISGTDLGMHLVTPCGGLVCLLLHKLLLTAQRAFDEGTARGVGIDCLVLLESLSGDRVHLEALRVVKRGLGCSLNVS